jgi:lipopolysaccharide heptosyltransferase II
MRRSKKLLIRLSSAGDVLLTSPLLKLMREREPESEIHFVAKSQYADLIRLNPNIDRVHLVQDHSDFHQLERLRRTLIAEHFDLTLDLHNNFRSAYLRRGSAPEIHVISKDIFKRAVLVNAKLNLFSTVRSVALKYAQTYDKSISRVAGPEMFLPPESIEKADEKWKSFGPEPAHSVFLCPGARHFTKRWPEDYWKELARQLQADGRVVLLGGTTDTEMCARIADGTSAVNLCGQLSLTESSAMLRHASVVVTNDSFLMHAANALGTRLVAIFGSSVREFGFFPYGADNKVLEVNGLTCRPCSHIGLESCPKGHFRCMKETRPSAVKEAVISLLKS